MLLPVSQLLIKASISLAFVWESFFALSEWIRDLFWRLFVIFFCEETILIHD